MGRKSVRENKNRYQISREAAELTREAAAEQMIFVSDDRIEKVESGKSQIHPEEVAAMAECYKDATLCNYYCANECPIGRKFVPEIKMKELPQITLELINSLNQLEKQKDRFVEIAADGHVTDDEEPDFENLEKTLNEMAVSVQTLQLWLMKERQ